MTATLKSPPPHDAQVSRMFGGIARFYDLLNHLLSLGLDYYWRSVLAKAVVASKGGLVLDLAAGTLDVSLAITKEHPNVTVAALDFCAPMLKLGVKKLQGKNTTTIIPIVADAKRLPIPDASVDCITIAFGIRNIIPRSEAFAEMLRVLRPGGKACILEFGSGSEVIWGGLYNFYLTHLLPRIGRLFSKDPTAYEYLAKTICAFPAALQFEEEMQRAGFIQTSYQKLTSGIVCLHVGCKKA